MKHIFVHLISKSYLRDKRDQRLKNGETTCLSHTILYQYCAFSRALGQDFNRSEFEVVSGQAAGQLFK